MTSKEISNCLGDHPQGVIHLYMNLHTKYMHWHLGGNFGRHQNATFCYQKVATRSRSMSVHLDFSYDASRAHRRGRGDKTKN